MPELRRVHAAAGMILKLDCDALSLRLTELLGPFGFRVRVMSMPHLRSVQIYTDLQWNKERLGNSIAMSEMDLSYRCRDADDVERFVTETARQLLINAFDYIAQPLPQAPQFDYRPNDMIPEDYFA